MSTPPEENIKREFYDPAVIGLNREFDDVLQKVLAALRNIARLIDGFTNSEKIQRQRQGKGQQLGLPFDDLPKHPHDMLKEMEGALVSANGKKTGAKPKIPVS